MKFIWNAVIRMTRNNFDLTSHSLDKKTILMVCVTIKMVILIFIRILLPATAWVVKSLYKSIMYVFIFSNIMA
jgi:hypothetical protein